MTVTCDCYPGGITSDNFEGPKKDCPEHGRRESFEPYARDDRPTLETIPGLLPRLMPERDDLPGYWEHGLDIHARPCPICGRFAHVVAFSDKQHWTVTDCRNPARACGMVRVDRYWAPLWLPRTIRRL